MVPANPRKINEIFSEMLHCYRENPVKYHARMTALVENLVMNIAESAIVPTPDSDPYEIDHIAKLIRRDPFQRFDLQAIAAKYNVSRAHLRRLFRQKMQMPFSAYIWNQKMSRAAELLRKTDFRIKEIAFTCCCDSQIEFSRSFKRYAKMSPRQYRETFRKRKNGNEKS